MNLPKINTKHCYLTIPKYSDASLLCEYYLKNKINLEVWEPTRSSEFYTKGYWQSQVCDSIQLFKDKQAVKMIALNKDKTHVIGICNFNNIVFGCFDACHMGYSIDKSYEGQGIMQEIVKAGIQYMADEFKLNRIMANHMPNNFKSEKLLNKLGFEKEGYAKAYLKINGKWQDHILNSLILPSK